MTNTISDDWYQQTNVLSSSTYFYIGTFIHGQFENWKCVREDSENKNIIAWSNSKCFIFKLAVQQNPSILTHYVVRVLLYHLIWYLNRVFFCKDATQLFIFLFTQWPKKTRKRNFILIYWSEKDVEIVRKYMLNVALQ